jgi:DNA-binding MarR family transcriptional regulator
VSAHTANLLGALVVSLHDRMSEAFEEEAAQTETGAATLTSLDQFLDRPTIGRLHQVVGLTHSGAVRLLDRLESDKQLRRVPGADGRSRSVELTRSGQRAARRVAERRAEVLQKAMSALSAKERKALDALLSRMLVELMRGPGATRWMCRLCDMDACERDRGGCPVANAAAERFGAGDRPAAS